MVRRLRSTPRADAVGDVDPVAEREDVRSPSCGLLHALGTREARAALAQPLRSDRFSALSFAKTSACRQVVDLSVMTRALSELDDHAHAPPASAPPLPRWLPLP